jgi:hypothetical protein
MTGHKGDRISAEIMLLYCITRGALRRFWWNFGEGCRTNGHARAERNGWEMEVAVAVTVKGGKKNSSVDVWGAVKHAVWALRRGG